MGQIQIQAWSRQRSELFTVIRQVSPLNYARGGEVCYCRLHCLLVVELSSSELSDVVKFAQFVSKSIEIQSESSSKSVFTMQILIERACSDNRYNQHGRVVVVTLQANAYTAYDLTVHHLT